MRWFWQKQDRPLFDRPGIDYLTAVRLGEECKRLLESEYYIHAIESVVDDIAIQWLGTPTQSEREELWRTQKSIALIQAKLNQRVHEGIAAAAVQEGDDRLTALG